LVSGAAFSSDHVGRSCGPRRLYRPAGSTIPPPAGVIVERCQVGARKRSTIMKCVPFMTILNGALSDCGEFSVSGRGQRSTTRKHSANPGPSRILEPGRSGRAACPGPRSNPSRILEPGRPGRAACPHTQGQPEPRARTPRPPRCTRTRGRGRVPECGAGAAYPNAGARPRLRGRAGVITATYPGDRRKVHMIMEIVYICPIFDGELSPGDEISVHITAKSPLGENST
jgi:hypothetical protein